MTESLVVILNGQIAGEVLRQKGGKLQFDYSDKYRKQPGATPLSLSMPIQIQSHPDSAIVPWLWGLLPENDMILTTWAREFQVSASSPFSLLSTPIGLDCAGAVQFTTSDRLDDVLSRSGKITWLSDDNVEERLRSLRQDGATWLGSTFTGQFSLAGAQAKTALIFKNKRWGVPSGSIPTTHILKPAVIGFKDHDLNEHLCLDAARRATLLAVRTRIAHFDTESAVVIDRYDRQFKGADILRIHQEDLCQALGISPLQKYQSEGGPSPSNITKLFRNVMSTYDANKEALRFADYLIWNWIIAGTDAHAKNYSLLLSGNQVRLAPFYDVSSALPYGKHEKKLRLAMKIGGDYAVFASRNTWIKASKELGVDTDLLVARVVELARLAPDAFADAAREPQIASLKRELPTKLVDLIAERTKRYLKVVS